MQSEAHGWEPVRSRGRLIYWRRLLPDGGWLAVAKNGSRWHWARRGPRQEPGGGGLLWYEGHRSTSALARRDADRAVNDPDRYGPTDICQTCDVAAQECGHRRPESDQALSLADLGKVGGGGYA